MRFRAVRMKGLSRGQIMQLGLLMDAHSQTHFADFLNNISWYKMICQAHCTTKALHYQALYKPNSTRNLLFSHTNCNLRAHATFDYCRSCVGWAALQQYNRDDQYRTYRPTMLVHRARFAGCCIVSLSQQLPRCVQYMPSLHRIMWAYCCSI